MAPHRGGAHVAGRLVITAVNVEGRSKSEVARDYRVSRYWVQQLVQPLRSRGRGRVPAAVPAAAFQPARDQPRPRTRSSGCARTCPSRAWTPARKPSHATWRARHPAERRPAFDAGRLDDLAGPDPPRIRHPRSRGSGRGSPENVCAEQPNERWQADTTHWQLADGTGVEILNIIDDHSRLALSRGQRHHHRHRCVASFRVAFRRYGIPASVLTDNGAVFTGKPRGGGRVALEIELDLLGVRFHHSRPYHPQTCGKVERFHQTQKKWLAAQPPAAPSPTCNASSTGSAATTTPSDPTGRSAGAPREAYQARPKASRHASIPVHYRVRRDKTDTSGVVTLRYDSRLRHIGLGRRPRPQPASPCSSTTSTSASSTRDTGELIRELTLDPTRDYQPLGRPPRPTQKEALKCNDVPRHLSTVSRDITV